MSNKNYDILGVSEYATTEEITQKYNELVAKYSEERFLEGEVGNIAAKKLNEVRVAYGEILEQRRQSGFDSDNAFKEVDAAIRSGDLRLAQQKLDEFDNRSAEWHYLQSVVFYKKNWNNECKKQLEIAMQISPETEKYKTAYEKLVNKMNGEKSSASQDEMNYDRKYSSQEQQHQQMGGDGCVDFCCRLLACNMLLNCCCNCN